MSQEKTPAKKAEEAIRYMLLRIATNKFIAYYFIATEAHAKLVAAYAALTGKSEEEVQKEWMPRESVDPESAETFRKKLDNMHPTDALSLLDEWRRDIEAKQQGQKQLFEN